MIFVAVQPFHERIPYEVLELGQDKHVVMASGKLDGSTTIAQLPGQY